MSFSMSGSGEWGYSYSRFAHLDAKPEAKAPVEAAEAVKEEEVIEEGYAKYQEGGEVKKSDAKKDEEECDECDKKHSKEDHKKEAKKGKRQKA